jgi:hypothetical protein
MNQPKIYYVPWVLSPYRAMTIPPFGIFIKKKYRGDKKILNHDMVHWEQYQRLGLFRFYLLYFKQFIQYGYDNMPMEIEARYEEDEYAKKHYSKVYHGSNKNSI